MLNFLLALLLKKIFGSQKPYPSVLACPKNPEDWGGEFTVVVTHKIASENVLNNVDQ